MRRSKDRVISTVGFPILTRWHHYIESALSSPNVIIAMADEDLVTQRTKASAPIVLIYHTSNNPASNRDGFSIFVINGLRSYLSDKAMMHAWQYRQISKIVFCLIIIEKHIYVPCKMRHIYQFRLYIWNHWQWLIYQNTYPFYAECLLKIIPTSFTIACIPMMYIIFCMAETLV